MRTHDLALLLLTAAGLLGSSAALAQDSTASPRINRNPEFRNQLPPAPPVLPDPRDSSTRPAEPPAQLPADGRSVLVTPPATPASAPASSPAAR
jgi:hypothetical protein